MSLLKWSRVSVAICGLLVGVGLAQAKDGDPGRIRGQITTVKDNMVEIQTKSGETKRIQFNDQVTVLKLSPASFAEVDFGVYVGAVSEKIGDDVYSPIYRDSLSWLHRGFELRIIDDNLRGIAFGVQKWDATEESIMTHGWVDDLEIRVLSIKYGPTEAEETDVEFARDLKILRMGLGDRSLIKPNANIFSGVKPGANGDYIAEFLMVGVDGVVPGL